MHDYNTETSSDIVFWYLRGLQVSNQLDPPTDFPYYHAWQWTDAHAQSGYQAPHPRAIVYADKANYYIGVEKNYVISALAPIDAAFPAAYYSLGAHLTAIATYRERLYVLDIKQRAIHVVRVSPEWKHLETLPVPGLTNLVSGTRLAVWKYEHDLRILLWDPTKRGYEYLVQNPATRTLHRRQTSLCWPGQDASKIQIGDAVVDASQAGARGHLYLSEVRTGSIHAVELAALEHARDPDDGVVVLVRGGTGQLRFGEPDVSSLVTPISLAIFEFTPEQYAPLKGAFGEADGIAIARQRLLVCVDSGSKCVVTVGLRPGRHTTLPLIGSSPVMEDRTNLTHEPARFTTVVRGQDAALLFGTTGSPSSWRVLRPWIPSDGDVARARTGGHS